MKVIYHDGSVFYKFSCGKASETDKAKDLGSPYLVDGIGC